MRFNLRKGYSVADMMEAVDNISLPLSSICKGAFTRQSVTISYRNDAAGLPDAGSDCTKVAIFVFTTDIEGEYAEIEVPAIKDEYIVSTGDTAGLEVDITHPSVIAFVDALTSGVWVSLFGYDIFELVGTVIGQRSA